VQSIILKNEAKNEEKNEAKKEEKNEAKKERQVSIR
jgi:hypothetical protein